MFQMIERGPHRSHCQRVLEVCAREKCRLRSGVRFVPVVPHAAVNRIHITACTGQDADGYTRARSFAIDDEVCLNAEQRLRPAGMKSKAGDYLIEDQSGLGLASYCSQLAQESFRT